MHSTILREEHGGKGSISNVRSPGRRFNAITDRKAEDIAGQQED